MQPMPTYLEIFGFTPEQALALNNALDSEGALQVNLHPTRTLMALLARLKDRYDAKYPNGAENYTISSRVQNLNIEEQRITYTITIDRFIDATIPVIPAPIVPAA